MGTFDTHVDSPDQIRIEGEDIEIKFERVDSTTGRVTWNIPSPAHGCNADTQAYCGIVIVLNTVANKVKNRPVNGTIYTADPTGDADLHSGDKIHGALVIGAFYNDKETTSLDISGLESDTAYFITGHAVDCVHRYHNQGISTYALPYLYTEPQNDSCGYQEVTLGGTKVLTDATGLSTGTTFTVNLQINAVDYQLNILGANAQTYEELIFELNKAIKLLENPFIDSTPPNTGAYWYDSTTGKLFQWDGFQHIEIGLITESEDPTDVVDGEYWFDVDDNNLYLRSGGAWILQDPIDSGFDPADPPCDVFWAQLVDSPETVSQVYKWDGSVWCERTTFEQEKDPSCPPDLTCSTYWYDEESEMLFVWNEDTQQWDQTEAIVWDTDPRVPAIGTLWFDDSENKLFERINATTWVEQSVTVSEEEPSFSVVGDYWFVPSQQELFTRTAASPKWISTDVLIWGEDPTVTQSCDLWWDTSSSPQTLNVWDVVNSVWTQVDSFFITSTDPSQAQSIPLQSVWVQTGEVRIYWEWDGSQFVQISSANLVERFTDPTDVSVGDVWHDTVNNIFFERVAGTVWEEQDVIASAEDPTMLPIGTFWFNITNNTLNMWNGVAWISVMFSTLPLTPSGGTLWYNTGNEELMEWDSAQSAWIISTPLAVVTFNDAKGCEPNGNIIITTTLCGSFGNILIGEVVTSGDLTTFVQTTFNFTGTLFEALGLSDINLKPNIIGVDGLTGIPSYDTVGVGTDGTADERRQLIHSIKVQLGYPTIEVELTKEQMNEAVQKALESLRQRSASAYRRVYFFMDAKVGLQNYLMTNERVGFNKIVNVMGVWRITSAFLSTVHAAGVFGQTILQHLYHMGTYDLVSYHLISDYIEQLEQLFATRVTYTFDEGTRQLFLFQRITRDERVLLDCVIERTEQELMTNRYTKVWLEKWTLAEARMMLAEIRGKYASLPGAGGGVALNAADLQAKATEEFAQCIQDVDDFVVNDIENLGIGSELIIG